MRRFTLTAALLIAGFAGSASAQGIAPNGVVFGQAWNLPQNLSTQTMTYRPRTAQGIGTTAAERAAREAKFNRNFPGTPIRPASALR